MAEIDFTKYDEVNKKVNDTAMEYVRKYGLFNPIMDRKDDEKERG